MKTFGIAAVAIASITMLAAAAHAGVRAEKSDIQESIAPSQQVGAQPIRLRIGGVTLSDMDQLNVDQRP